MKKLIKFVSAICLVVSAIAYNKPASAEQIPLPTEQWQVVLHDSGNNILSVDKGTITRLGNFTGFWTQTISPIGNVAISRIYTVGDCSSGVFQALWEQQANWQGKIIANNKVNNSVTPDKLLLNAVCQNPAQEDQVFPDQIVQKALSDSLAKNSPTTAGLFSRNRNYVFK
ncbi:hypothetical protein G7B40_038850 [Aetokthonos hydrillicola Thurmond2011]|jgi:hypothetical protein|uniref:Uncharacterized protein n=2 Tax=Aetokthonos TaxID=1550243 RepID=A0AAP5IID9_9CYAN|nr:hypothetical protein [Aetokthonos hydrillicola]MBO3461323.1 hypothetical protein [Aetokthonos hydrillicola CCALA 1050]MBW4589280.1 hypothetical protein [Aetokthonos hydrillicola CCALA 1050]MDR9900465.1 hypothetical protein [Aetokthonos hydrillicola Thurmond2011]